MPTPDVSDTKGTTPEPVDLLVRAGFLFPVDGEHDGMGGGALYTVAFRGESQISDEDWRRLAQLGCVEMIRAGITTLNDFWYAADAMAETALATGLRLELATEIVDVDKTRLAEGDYSSDTALGERRLREGAEVARRWHGAGDGLITARLGPHATDTCAGGLHREAAAEARRLGVGLHCHVAQSRQEIETIRAAHGAGPATWLAVLGVLGPDWVLAHLTFADAADHAAVAAAGAGYAHCATIYPRRGVYPDLLSIRGQGVRTGLATDWMLNDPFEAMRGALNAVRLREGRHDALTTAEALELATAGAAEAMGMGRRTRSAPTASGTDSGGSSLRLRLRRESTAPLRQAAWPSGPKGCGRSLPCSFTDGRDLMPYHLHPLDLHPARAPTQAPRRCHC